LPKVCASDVGTTIITTLTKAPTHVLLKVDYYWIAAIRA